MDKSTANYSANGYGLALIYSPARLYFYGNGSSLMSSTNILTINTWHHVALTFKKSNRECKIYINGTLTNTATASKDIVGTTACPLGIGNWPHTNGQRYIQGNIAEVRIWKTLLTASHIETYKNARLNTDHPSINSLVGYWKCDEGSGMTLVNTAYLLNTTITSGFDATISHMTATTAATSDKIDWSSSIPETLEAVIGGFAGAADSSQNIFIVGNGDLKM